MKYLTQSLSQKAITSKLMMGFLVAAATVLVGTASVANAASGFGYGGVNININNQGSGNVIVVIINYFFG